MANEHAMIQVDKLTKDYGGKLAVNSISFEVHPGEVLGFLGPNGAGKSTTMKMLTCFLAPTSGSARVGGHDVRTASLEVRRMVGYLPEDTPLYHDMTSLEFLQFISEVRSLDAGRRPQRIREISRVCGLDDVLAQPVGELSKGYRQRLGLAQAMIHDPPILILDEPTSGLDPNQIVEIRELIRKIGKQKTVILSTHILPEVQATCGRVIIISDGKLVADGTPDELASRQSQNEYRLVVDASEGQGGEPYRENAESVSSKLHSLPGVLKVKQLQGEKDASAWQVQAEGSRDLRRELFQCIKDSGWILLEMQRKALSLEEVFRKLTRE